MVAKTSKRDPFAAIEHRVIDSPAYADMGFSSHSLLLLLARQLTKDNNGHLQASFAWCSKHGFGSEHTLRTAIAELISHGFIYRTRSHGANKAWARYAVTWLSVTKKDGLFLSGFRLFAWRDWKPTDAMTNGKSTRQKVRDQSGRKCSFTPDNPAENAGRWGAKSADYELIPVVAINEALSEQLNEHPEQRESTNDPGDGIHCTNDEHSDSDYTRTRDEDQPSDPWGCENWFDEVDHVPTARGRGKATRLHNLGGGH